VSSATTGDLHESTRHRSRNTKCRAQTRVFDPIDDETLVDSGNPECRISRASRIYAILAGIRCSRVSKKPEQPSIVTTNPTVPREWRPCIVLLADTHYLLQRPTITIWRYGRRISHCRHDVLPGHGRSRSRRLLICSLYRKKGTVEGQVYAVCNASDNPAKIQLYVYTGGGAAVLPYGRLVATTARQRHMAQTAAYEESTDVFDLIINGTVWGSASSNI
jgi:hypothetical protein